ncbi:gamma-glutamyltranspeptidase [Halorhodospira halochloris]|uniref:Gamma-glutamyltranspeptidase n=1 Tax=Halorhodospira halochloris TaxID=1052 RepID=A0A0X8X7E4_HALHR|nr:gamma-glutamyltranspeptidase [Halorhodospira halochloris]
MSSIYVLGRPSIGNLENFAGATIRPGAEDAVNPSLEASWRHLWRQDLHTGAAKWLRGSCIGLLQWAF